MKEGLNEGEEKLEEEELVEEEEEEELEEEEERPQRHFDPCRTRGGGRHLVPSGARLTLNGILR